MCLFYKNKKDLSCNSQAAKLQEILYKSVSHILTQTRAKGSTVKGEVYCYNVTFLYFPCYIMKTRAEMEGKVTMGAATRTEKG